MLRQNPLLLVGVMMLMVSGCVIAGPAITGSGVSKTESRDVPEFKGVRTSGSADIHITIGKERSVVVIADDNILPVLRTEVEDGVLRIESKESISPKTKITVAIVTPTIRSVGIAGSGKVSVKGVKEDKLALSIAGSGDLKAQGSAESISAKIAGSGDMDLGDLAAREATAKIDGSGGITVNASDSLEASIAGSGAIRYIGQPKNVQRSVTGSGSVKPKT